MESDKNNASNAHSFLYVHFKTGNYYILILYKMCITKLSIHNHMCKHDIKYINVKLPFDYHSYYSSLSDESICIVRF